MILGSPHAGEVEDEVAREVEDEGEGAPDVGPHGGCVGVVEGREARENAFGMKARVLVRDAHRRERPARRCVSGALPLIFFACPQTC